MRSQTEWEWRDLDSSAARWAAPWWLLTWIITGGRFGKPLFRIVQAEVSTRPSSPPGQEEPEPYFPHRRGDGYQPTQGPGPDNPPQGGSGVPPAPTPGMGLIHWDGEHLIPCGTDEDSSGGGIQVIGPGGEVRTYVWGPHGEMVDVTSFGDDLSPPTPPPNIKRSP